MAGENGAPRLSAVPAYSHQPPRQPQSPSVVQQPSPVTQASPSTVQESPRLTPSLFVANVNAPVGPRAPGTRMRANIACMRCRKSKTKCENTGTDSVCKSCAAARPPTKCTYGNVTPSTSSASVRRESTADVEGPPKKRRKNLVPTSSTASLRKDALGTLEDALDSPLLTPQVWRELFEIYEKHLAIDFPFFHKRTFLSCVQRGRTVSSDENVGAPSSMLQPYYPPLLLAFLTQTARFHPKLVEQKNNDPIATAEFYAEATIRSMGFEFLSDPTLEKVQTLLLLGYHEWTALQGSKGWLRIGCAIRAAQLLKYHTDADRDNEERSTDAKGERSLSDKDQFVLRETQRRTFWSCYIMDRYLSLGEDRPSMFKREDFRVQLVCSDSAFNFGRNVRTRHLGDGNAKYEYRRLQAPKPVHHQHDGHVQFMSRCPDLKWEIGDAEDEFVWYMPVVELFGDITKWSCRGGRRQEGKIPPWDSNTTFKILEDRLARLKSELPQYLQLTPENTEDRIYSGSDKYVLIHAMYTLCTVSLYREYMPMAPWGCTGPRGPLEEPLITETPPQPNYWVDQARTCWRACRGFTDLLHAIQSAKSNSGPIMSPTVAFSAFTVALCTIYCHIFPNMDPDSALSSRLQPRAHDTANRYLIQMVDHFKMVRCWIEHEVSWQRYYIEERRKYKKLGGNVGDSPRSSSSDSGGPLKDYTQLFEQHHKQFGSTDHNDNKQWTNRDKNLADILLHDDDLSELESAQSASVKREKEEKSEAISAQSPAGSGGFTAVNTPPTSQSVVSNDVRMLANAQAATPLSPLYSFPMSVPNSRSRPPTSPTTARLPSTPSYSDPRVETTRDHNPNSIHAAYSEPERPELEAARAEMEQARIEMEKARAEMEQVGSKDLSKGPMHYGPIVIGNGDTHMSWD